MALKPITQKPVETEAKPIVLVSEYSLLEPINQIRFPAGKPVEVEAITGWMQAQIDAGLMSEI